MRATAYIELGQYEKAIAAAESSYEMVIHKNWKDGMKRKH